MNILRLKSSTDRRRMQGRRRNWHFILFGFVVGDISERYKQTNKAILLSCDRKHQSEQRMWVWGKGISGEKAEWPEVTWHSQETGSWQSISGKNTLGKSKPESSPQEQKEKRHHMDSTVSVLVCVYMYVYMGITQIGTCRDQRKTCVSQFSLTMRNLGIELRFPSLEANAFTS